jgi:hypothetical protein
VIGFFEEQPFYWIEGEMTGLRKTFLLAGAAAALAITALIDTPFAQNGGVSGDPTQALSKPDAAPNAASMAADKKAEDAMTVEPNPASLTNADRKAAAAMGMGSGPAPTK